MNNELALRTIGYLIGHYKTHNETIINSQEIEAIEFLIKENQALKEQVDYLRRSIERKEETIIDLEHERVPYTNEYVDKLINQQKEFIEYLEKEKERCLTFYSSTPCMYAYDVFKEILLKYKSIIGGKNDSTK